MKQPRRKLFNILLLAVLAPLLLTGIITRLGEPTSGAQNIDLIDIEQLVKHVMSLNRSHQPEKAINHLLAAVDQHGENSLLRAVLVQTFDAFLENEIRQGQVELQKDPANISAMTRISGALELVGDPFRSMEVLLNGLRFKTDSADLWMKIARLELKAHRDREALEVFREVVRLDSKNSDALNNVAFLLLTDKKCDAEDLQEAAELATKARRINPHNAEYLDTLAQIRFKQGDAKKAISLINEAINLAPDNDSFKTRRQLFKEEYGFVAE